MTTPAVSLRDEFQGGGAPTLTCSCGRTHVAMAGREDSDRDWWQALASDPRRGVVTHPGDCVTQVNTAAGDFVDECECNGMARYEASVWQDRAAILRYFRARANADAAEAARDLAELNGVSDR